MTGKMTGTIRTAVGSGEMKIKEAVPPRWANRRPKLTKEQRDRKNAYAKGKRLAQRLWKETGGNIEEVNKRFFCPFDTSFHSPNVPTREEAEALAPSYYRGWTVTLEKLNSRNEG